MRPAAHHLPDFDRIARFAIVGVLAAAVDMAALWAAVHLLGLDLYSGRILSYLAAATFAWWMNRRFSFADRSSENAMREWLRYVSANLLGGVINYAVYALLVSTLDLFAAYPFLAVAIGSLAGMTANFAMSQRFVFVGHDEKRDRPRKAPEQPVGLWQLAGWITIATILFLGVNYGLNGYLMTVDKAPIRSHLKQAFADGDLGTINSRGDDSVMGVHQTNDCLIFDMAARDSTGDLIYLFAGARTGAVRAEKAGNCELLRDWLERDPTQQFSEVWYLRYIHGYRSVAVALLDNFTVVETRAILKAASYGSLLLAILLNLGFAVRRSGSVREALSSNFVGYALIAASLLGFFGLPYFGQSISHAPAIVTLSGFLVAWSTLDRLGRLTERTALSAIIVYALFTAYFEYLTGYIPVGSCLIVALVAIAWGPREKSSPWSILRLVVLCEAAFAGTIFAAFAFHTLASASASSAGLDVFSLFLDRLSSRMAQTAPGEATGGLVEVRELTLIDVGAALLKALTHLGIWSQQTMVAIIVGSLGISVMAAYDMIFVRGRAGARFAAAIAAVSFLPVIVWILAFQNHTTVHAAFMVRILVVIPMAGMLAIWSWYRVAAVDWSPAGLLAIRSAGWWPRRFARGAARS